MLFCKPNQYFYVSEAGKKILENRHLFLSKRAFYTFGGYANAQLNRLENALARDENAQSEEERLEHINRSITNANMSFIEKFNLPEGGINTYVGQFDDKPQILVDINLKGYPLSRLRGSIEEMTNVLRDYDKTIGHKNHKKDDIHLNKHMMHLIRLYLMCNEILQTGDLHTYREKDHELLMKIRNGYFRNENGGVKNEFYEMLNELKTNSEELYKKTTLPKTADKKRVSEIVFEIYKKYIFN